MKKVLTIPIESVSVAFPLSLDHKIVCSRTFIQMKRMLSERAVHKKYACADQEGGQGVRTPWKITKI